MIFSNETLFSVEKGPPQGARSDGGLGLASKDQRRRRRRSLFVFSGYYRGTQGARCYTQCLPGPFKVDCAFKFAIH